MTISQHRFHSSVTGSEIFRVSAAPDDPGAENRGTVLVLHGLGDHIGCHEKAMEIFSNLGYRSEGFDWPGNGKSSGNRGDIPGVRPALKLIEEVIGSLKEKPVAIYAHSTGAFLVLPFIAREENQASLKWLWLSSPLLRPTHGQSKAKRWIAEFLADWFPELSMPTGVKPSRCYHTKAKPVSDAREFKQCHSKISARFGRDLLLWESEVARSATKLKNPLRILVTQGDEDRICPPQYAGEFFHTIPATNKSFKLLEGMLHEPFHELNNQRFLDTVSDWIESNS